MAVGTAERHEEPSEGEDSGSLATLGCGQRSTMSASQGPSTCVLAAAYLAQGLAYLRRTTKPPEAGARERADT